MYTALAAGIKIKDGGSTPPEEKKNEQIMRWKPSLEKPMTKRIFTIAAGLLTLHLIVSPPTYAAETPFSGQVISVSDGDTIKVLRGGMPEKIRLSGIDCPEKSQAYGSIARRMTSELCFGKQVGVIPIDRDRYGRTVAQVILPDGRILNSELVKHGYAWWYRKYSPLDRDLQQLEANARANRAGLWSDPNPLAPWDFRHIGEQKSRPTRTVNRPF